jgi:hypothetical protein
MCYHPESKTNHTTSPQSHGDQHFKPRDHLPPFFGLVDECYLIEILFIYLLLLLFYSLIYIYKRIKLNIHLSNLLDKYLVFIFYPSLGCFRTIDV